MGNTRKRERNILKILKRDIRKKECWYTQTYRLKNEREEISLFSFVKFMYIFSFVCYNNKVKNKKCQYKKIKIGLVIYGKN